MDVWVTWCKRIAQCHFCPDTISVAEPMVIGKQWKNTELGRRFTYKLYWHPQCWLDSGMKYLSDNPYTPTNSGRPRIELSKEDHDQRNKLLRQFGSLKSRLNKTNDIARHTEIERNMLLIAEQMFSYGGIPESWKKVLRLSST